MKDPKQLLVRNIFSNWFTLAVKVAVVFYMTPFMVHHLGKESFGVWALVFSIIAYADFLDLGMRQSLARYLPKYYAVKDYDGLNRVINSSSFMYGIFGTVSLTAAVVIALFFLGLFNISGEQVSAMRWTLILIGASTAIKFYAMPSTSIGPFHRYDVRNGISIFYLLISTAVQIYYLMAGCGIVTLAVINLGSTTFGSITRRWFQQRLIPQIKFGRRYLNKDTIRKMLSYGSYSFLIIVVNLVIFNSDNVIIGIVLSTTFVTYYAIALTVISYLRSMINAIGVPLVPAISHFEATGDLKVVAGMSEQILKYLFYLCTGACCGILIFGADFIRLWMGPGFELTVDILYILVVPAIVYLPQVASNSILFGIGKHRLLLVILAVEAVANIALSLVLVFKIGILGVALGTAIPQIIIYSFVYPVAYHRVLNASVKRFYVTSLRSILLGAVFAGPVGLLVKEYLATENWAGFSIGVILTGLVILAGFVWLVLERDDRRRIWSSLREFRDNDGNQR